MVVGGKRQGIHSRVCAANVIKRFIMAAARFPSASDITTREFHAATDSEVNTAAWCKRFGLLATHKTCPVCAQPMVWSLRADRGTAFRWRCGRPCAATVTIRVDTFFDKSNLRIRTILDLIRCWAYEELSFKKAQREFAISQHLQTPEKHVQWWNDVLKKLQTPEKHVQWWNGVLNFYRPRRSMSCDGMVF